MASTDDYLALITSQHRQQPNFAEVVKLLTNPLAEGINLCLSLADAFDLDKASGAQLDAIGLWVGMLRKVPVPLTDVYFTWDTPSPKSAPVLGDVVGGALAARTYYVRLTYEYAAGNSLPGPEASRAVPANSLLTVTAPPADPAATGYNVYVSTSSGTQTKQNGAAIAFGTNWTEPTSGLIAGAAMPTTSIGQKVGWGDGYWKGNFDPTNGVSEVDDATYRMLIRAKIAANFWDGSLETMYKTWAFVFGPGVIEVLDNQDMTITIVYDSLALSTVMKQLLTSNAFPLKPAGVLVNYLASTGTPIFAWDQNTAKFQGWESGSWT